MAQYDDSYPLRSEAGEELSGWTMGFIFLGSVMMMILGGFHLIAGLTALLDDSFYAVGPGFALEIDVTTWGWVHLIGGTLIVATGLWLLAGSTAARYITIVGAVISAIWNFYSIPYYPVWSILMLVLCIGVLWALIAHGKEFTSAMKDVQK
jgi:hypothetical protein